MKIKGKVFPSFTHTGPNPAPSGKAGPGRALPAGQQYTGFCGKRASTRYLKQQCRDVWRSKDPAVQMALQMCQAAIPDTYQLHFFISRAKQVSHDTGASLIDAMNALLEKFEELKQPPTNTDTPLQQEEIHGTENGTTDTGAMEGTDRGTAD